MPTVLDGAVGLAWRRELAASLLAAPHRVDFVEVVAEACRDPAQLREAHATAAVWPVVPHGVKLSLGSVEGIDDDRARLLERLARELRAPCVSEHVSFVRAAGREIGHLTDLPRTREAIRVVARNVARLRAHLGDVPLLLENVASTFIWTDEHHEMTEPQFYTEIVEATGCHLLLDVGNLHANAVNSRRDALELLAQFPLERVAMVHVAGGVLEDGFYFDTHAHPVSDAVFSLVSAIRGARPKVPVLLERDGTFDDDAALLAEVDRLRRAPARAIKKAPDLTPHAPRANAPLALALSTLAECLSDDGQKTEPARFPPEALARARRVLEKKRADDALPLLGRLRSHLTAERALFVGRVAASPRLATMTAVRDAWNIAAGAALVPDLRAAAIEDALVLRARFRCAGRAPSPRVFPFVGRERLPTGEVLWAYKSMGEGAPVRVVRG